MIPHLVRDVADKLEGRWGELDPRVREDVRAALLDLDALLARHLNGEDVTEPLAQVRAQILSWSWVHADQVRVAVEAVLRKTGEAVLAFAVAALVAEAT